MDKSVFLLQIVALIILSEEYSKTESIDTNQVTHFIYAEGIQHNFMTLDIFRIL